MKKILSTILALFLFIITMGVCAEEEITVMVNGKTVDFDVAPVIENTRVLIPMCAIFEALGKEVLWDSENKTAVAMDETTAVSFVIGADEIWKQDKRFSAGMSEKIKIDAPAAIVQDRTLVPLRAVSEAFGNDVLWDGATRTVTITSPKSDTAGPAPQANVPVDTPEPAEVEGTYIQKLMAALPKDKNTVISPFSLKVAMMMAANGTKGETQKEILDAFGIEDINAFNEYILSKTESYVLDWEEYYLDAPYWQDENFGLDEIQIANSIWLNRDYYKEDAVAFNKQFADTIARYYNGTAKTVTNDTYASEVNHWINEMTYGRIPSLMLEHEDENTLLSIVNSVYLKAKWWLEFDAEDTKEDIFTDIDGNEVLTDFMNQETTYAYYEDADTKMVRIEYQNGFSMWLVLGDDTEFLSKIDDAENKIMNLSMPKFKIGYAADFRKILQGMGINKAFADGNREFTMLENVSEFVKIDSVLQKAIIDVNEKGTEASAVTDIGLVGLGRPNEKAEFKADRPFSYYIVDSTADKEILFAGRYVKCDG